MLDKLDIAYATFALGRFVQYALDEGMSEEMAAPFKQAYLNLTADQDGRERLDLRELQSLVATVPQTDLAEDRPSWPFWLHDHERLRRHLRARCT